MGFKHDNGRNSELYRSLEKIALQKGLIKEENLVKQAAVDFSPSKNLDMNILKLCSALTDRGLVAQAKDLEKNYLLYRAAKASDPKDVDVQSVRMAHPAGGTQVSNSYNEAYVEDILETHLSVLNVALKSPSGKFADNESILRAVKIVLAQDVSEDLNALNFKLNQKRNEVLQLITNLDNIIENSDDLTSLNAYWVQSKHLKTHMSEEPITIDSIESALKNIQKCKSFADPSWYGAGLSKDTWEEVSPIFTNIVSALTEMKSVRKEILRLKQVSNPAVKENPKDNFKATIPTIKQKDNTITKKDGKTQNQINFEQETAKALEDLRSWEILIAKNKKEQGGDYSAKDIETALRWINSKRNNISILEKSYNESPADLKAKLADQLILQLENLTWKEPGSFQSFKKVWIG